MVLNGLVRSSRGRPQYDEWPWPTVLPCSLTRGPSGVKRHGTGWFSANASDTGSTNSRAWSSRMRKSPCDTYLIVKTTIGCAPRSSHHVGAHLNLSEYDAKNAMLLRKCTTHNNWTVIEANHIGSRREAGCGQASDKYAQGYRRISSTR